MSNFTKSNTSVRTRELLNNIHTKYEDVLVEVTGDHLAGYKIHVVGGDTLDETIECGGMRASVNTALQAILVLGVATIIKAKSEYVAPAPFRSTKEQVDFLQAELDHQVELVKEFREKWEEAEAKLANVRKAAGK